MTSQRQGGFPPRNQGYPQQPVGPGAGPPPSRPKPRAWLILIPTAVTVTLVAAGGIFFFAGKPTDGQPIGSTGPRTTATSKADPEQSGHTERPAAPSADDPCAAVPRKVIEGITAEPNGLPTIWNRRKICTWRTTVDGDPGHRHVIRLTFPLAGGDPQDLMAVLRHGVSDSMRPVPELGAGAFGWVGRGTDLGSIGAHIVFQRHGVVAQVDVEGIRMHQTEGAFATPGPDESGELTKIAERVANAVTPPNISELRSIPRPAKSRFEPTTRLPADVCALVSSRTTDRMLGKSHEVGEPAVRTGGIGDQVICRWATVGEPSARIEGELLVRLKLFPDADKAERRYPSYTTRATDAVTDIEIFQELDPELGEHGHAYVLAGPARSDIAVAPTEATGIVQVRQGNMVIQVVYTAQIPDGDGKPITSEAAKQGALQVTKELLGGLKT